MQTAGRIGNGHTGVEVIGFHRLDLPGLVAMRRFDLLELGHHGLVGHLILNRPGVAVVMRGGFIGTFEQMGANAEAEVRVLIKDLSVFLIVRAEMGADEVIVHEIFFNHAADLVEIGFVGTVLEDVPALFCKGLDILAHGLIIAFVRWTGIMHRTAPMLNTHFFFVVWDHDKYRFCASARGPSGWW